MRTPLSLSKSRYTAGVQCHKLLWWKVHEPLAVELQPDKVLQDRFDQGAHVGTLARARFPGGVLIDLLHQAVNERVALTRKTHRRRRPGHLRSQIPRQQTFVAVDVLTTRGCRLSLHRGQVILFREEEESSTGDV